MLTVSASAVPPCNIAPDQCPNFVRPPEVDTFTATTPSKPDSPEQEVPGFCWLSAEDFGRAAMCVDSGASHHIFSAKYVAAFPEKFKPVALEETRTMPNHVGNWTGTSTKVRRYVWYEDGWPTDKGEHPVRLGPCIVSEASQWNLLSEELTVGQLDVVFTHDRDGKRIQFRDDHSVSWLHHSNGLQFVSPESSKRADAHIVGEVEQNVTDDVVQAREHQRTFVQDKFTQILDNVEVPPSDAFLQNYDVAYDHDLSLAEATLKSTVMSRTFEKLREILGFRSPPQVVKFANAAGMKLSDKDKKHSAAGLQGNAKLKPDVPGPTRQHHCGDKISQDPCRLPVIGFGGVTTVFFTSDAALGTVGVHATKDKSSMSAIESILEYIRQSNAYQRLGITRPKILKTDSEAIYTSETFLEWMRLGNSKTELSAPYHHRQNSQIERVIGVLWRSAVSMMHNAIDFKPTSGRNRDEFFHYALQHAALIDSCLKPNGSEKSCPYFRSEAKEPPFHMFQGAWGSPVMVAIPKAQQEGKLGVKARPGFFLGVSPYHLKSFQIYIPDTDRVISTQDVYFADSDGPRENWIPVLDDDELYECLDLQVDDPVDGKLSKVQRQRHGVEGGDNTGFQKTTSTKGKKKPKHPFKIDQHVVVDYGAEGKHAGIIDSIQPTLANPTSVTVYFPNEDTAATLPKKSFYLIKSGSADVNISVQVNDESGSNVDCVLFERNERKDSKMTGMGLAHKIWTMAAAAPAILNNWFENGFNTSEPALIHASTGFYDDELPKHIMDNDIPDGSLLFSRCAKDAFGFDWVDVESSERENLARCNVAPVSYTYKEILRMPKGKLRDDFLASVEKEMTGLENRCWDDEPCPPDGIILDTKVFSIQKPTADGTGACKTRCVVKGFMQPENSYGDTCAPVLLEHSMNGLFACIAAEDLNAVHLDYIQAFPTTDIDRPLWIRLPKDFGGKVKRLKKMLYGMKQASFGFIKMVGDALIEFGFVKSKSDPCVFIYQTNEPVWLLNKEGQQVTDPKERDQIYSQPTATSYDSKGNVIGYQLLGANDQPLCHKIIIGQYVDDCLIGYSRDNPLMEELYEFLREKGHKFTVEEMNFFLNMAVKRKRQERKLTLSQRQHMEKVVEDILGQDAEKINSRETPLPDGYMPEPSADHAGDRLAMTEEIKSNYRSWTASLLWISRTVPEIKFAVGQLCRHMQNPSVDHINDVKKVARYLVGNLDRGLTFTGNRLDVNAQSDSDWGACKHTRRSCTGYVVFIGESLVIAKSQMQKLVALSSMEAELIALNETAKSVMYYRTLLGELGFVQTEKSIILVDNQSCIQMSKSQMAVYRNRHIPLRYFYIKDLLKDDVELTWVGSADNVADLFTKSVAKDLFAKHKEKVSGVVIG